MRKLQRMELVKMMEHRTEIEENQNETNPRCPDFRQFSEVTEEILLKSLSKNLDSMIDLAVSFFQKSIEKNFGKKF